MPFSGRAAGGSLVWVQKVKQSDTYYVYIISNPISYLLLKYFLFMTIYVFLIDTQTGQLTVAASPFFTLVQSRLSRCMDKRSYACKLQLV